MALLVGAGCVSVCDVEVSDEEVLPSPAIFGLAALGRGFAASRSVSRAGFG
jgi:hypothetical protein